MNKIPTVFERDWAGDKSRVVNQIHPGCEWVEAGAGVATRKMDGTCCMISGGKLYKRRELRDGEVEPPGFELVERDEETGKKIGWIPVGDCPEDKWHRAAFSSHTHLPDGTYELCGPKIQGNPEHYADHCLISHDATEKYADTPRTFEGLRSWLTGRDIEGIVFHHPDGRMAKIKLRDFGLKRNTTSLAACG